ncbi:hypothetical protein ElyMa_002382200 [Elysia marginata]|uniref:Uncharacterized protein n=1 Tax=Elysia marginata TaxID=1093978 RepID=A0AAV4GCU7_9GAST|nr:hypothetical protein ElyMa_002382200 [Elysia marginata]
MGTSNRGGSSYKNISHGKSAKTMIHAVTNSRQRSALHGQRPNVNSTERGHGSGVNTKWRSQPTNSLRAFVTSRSNAGYTSARSEVDPCGCSSLGKDRENNVEGRYSLDRPSSASAGTPSSLPQRQALARPRPYSSVTSRSCVPSTTAPSYPQLRGRTLDDLPMQHSQQDALNMLERKRAETAAQHRILRQEGGEIKMVSSFGRRMFDSAVNNRGKYPLLQPSPSEAAALFYRASRPSWSSFQSEGPGHTDTSRSKPRPQSMVAGQSAPTGALMSSRQRPDSEPPTRWQGGREFNHLRNHRQMYPHINKLVQRYNEDMRVVCTQTPEVCERRRYSRDFSVASEFLLVPLRQDIEAEDRVDEHGDTDRETHGKGEEETHHVAFGLNKEGDLDLHQETKIEDQLSETSTQPSQKRGAAQEDAASSEGTGSEEEPGPPWRCWVDDATVSTVHSRAASLVSPEDAAAAEDVASGRPTSATARNLIDASGASLSGGAEKFSLSQPAEASVKATTPPQPAQALRERRGRRKKEEALPEPPPPPPPPVEEPQIVLEEMVEEEEPEPEPEPVPPSYICPSSEDKSHTVEIRRWLSKSQFRAATRTTPIF